MSINKQFSKLAKSRKSVEYYTPPVFFIKLNSVFDFQLDPCSDSSNPLDMKYYYTKENNGLTKHWDKGNTFINPPFGQGIREWIIKMRVEALMNQNSVYCMLLPARVETKWFQELIWDNVHTVMYFVKGRLKFVNPEHNPKNEPHNIGTMLWFLNVDRAQMYALKQQIEGISVWRSDNF